MPKTKRAQVLMEPVEYDQLADIARERDCSVADLVREAVREKYFTGTRDKQAIVNRIAGFRLAVDDDWVEVEKEIEEGRGKDVR